MVIDIVFSLMFVLFPILIVGFLKLLGEKVFKFTISSFVLICMFVFTYVGIMPLYFGWDVYRYETGIQDRDILLQMFLFSVWAIFSMALGVVAAKRNLAVRSEDYIGNNCVLSLKEKIVLLTYFSFAVVVLVLYLSKVTSIALLVLIQGEGDAGVARSLMGNDFAGKYHWYSLFMHDLMNFVCFALYANYLLSKRKFDLILFILVFLVASFSAVVAIEKAPFVWLLIGLFLVKVYSTSSRVFPLKQIFVLTVGLVGVLTTFYIIFMGVENVPSAITAIASRSFTGGIAPAYYYIEFFPEHHGFLMGRSFPNPGGLFPFSPYHLTVEMANYMHPENFDHGVVGSAPTVYWAEMYANFSTIGVILVPFFVGVTLFLIDRVVGTLRGSPIKAALVVWLAIHFKELTETNLSSFFFDTYLLVIVVLALAAIAVAHNGKIKLYRMAVL